MSMQDFGTILNISFYFMIGMGVLFGFMRGAKKSLFWLVANVIFYVFFFLTIDFMVMQLWTMKLANLGKLLGMISPEVNHVNTLKQALPILLEKFASESLGEFASHEEVLALATSLGLFVVKLIYTILYFTVINVFYKAICKIIQMIFFRVNKEKPRGRLLGATFGFARGALNVFLTLVVLGGTIATMEHVLKLSDYVQAENADEEAILAQVEQVNLMIDGYNKSPIVKINNLIQFKDKKQDYKAPLNLYLFDSVFSLNYQGERIALQKELQVFVNVIETYLDSTFIETNNVSDIKGDEIRYAFKELSNSKLFIKLLPLAIEFGAYKSEVEIDFSPEELYAIDWKKELTQMGELVALAFDMANSAGFFDENVNLETVTLDSQDVNDLFDALSESDLVNLAAYLAIEPLLKSAGETVQAIITVPEDIVFKDEFKAFGLIANEILSADLTLGDFKEKEPQELLVISSSINVTVLLNSKLFSHALVNIISGKTEIEGLDIFVVPENVVWFDKYENDVRTEDGELRRILQAIQGITPLLSSIDFSNFHFNDLSNLTDDAIDDIFDSRVLSATISREVTKMELGSTPLIINDTLFDAENLIDRNELKLVVVAAKRIIAELACEFEMDPNCANYGINLSGIFQIDSETKDAIFNSTIISQTLGNLIYDQVGPNSQLVIPSEIYEIVLVNNEGVFIVKSDELRHLFEAGSALNITNIDDINVDLSILKILAKEDDDTALDTNKSNAVFNSLIIHATLSQLLLDLTSNGLIQIPYQSFNEIDVRYQNATETVEFISKDELNALIDVSLSLDLSDFDLLSSIDLSVLLTHVNKLLDSSIFHATVSKQIIDLNNPNLVVPTKDSSGLAIQKQVGDVGFTTDYISVDEITNLLDILTLLNIQDFNNFNGTFDLSEFYDQGNQSILLNSAIMQASISKQLLSFNQIIIPNEDQSATPIRVDQDETTYVSRDELEKILDVLKALAITDINNLDFSANMVLTIDLNVLLSSTAVSATVSEQILLLGGTSIPDETDTVTTPSLIIPSVFRYDIIAGTNTHKVIEQTELLNLLTAFKAIGLTNFGDDLNSGLITGMDDDTLDTLLMSGSIHASISNMMNQNSFIIVPDLAVAADYNINDLITQTEIKAFIKATQVFGSGDFMTFSFDFDDLMGVDEDTLDTMLDSMIIRLIVTDLIEESPYYNPILFGPTDYEISNPPFLKKAPIVDFIDYYKNI